jgi:hypothetical protein
MIIPFFTAFCGGGAAARCASARAHRSGYLSASEASAAVAPPPTTTLTTTTTASEPRKLPFRLGSVSALAPTKHYERCEPLWQPSITDETRMPVGPGVSEADKHAIDRALSLFPSITTHNIHASRSRRARASASPRRQRADARLVCEADRFRLVCEADQFSAIDSMKGRPGTVAESRGKAAAAQQQQHAAAAAQQAATRLS